MLFHLTSQFIVFLSNIHGICKILLNNLYLRTYFVPNGVITSRTFTIVPLRHIFNMGGDVHIQPDNTLVNILTVIMF